MRLNVSDGRCRGCGGPLDVIDASDATLTVACAECCDCYEVEKDAFADGGRSRRPAVIERQLREGEDDAPA